MSTINSFQIFTLANSGAYDDPLSIYLEEHKVLTNKSINEQPEISSIVQNIDLLVGDSLLSKTEESAIYKLSPILTEDFNIPPDKSGLSVDLNFSSHNITTTTNTFINI